MKKNVNLLFFITKRNAFGDLILLNFFYIYKINRDVYNINL